MAANLYNSFSPSSYKLYTALSELRTPTAHFSNNITNSMRAIPTQLSCDDVRRYVEGVERSHIPFFKSREAQLLSSSENFLRSRTFGYDDQGVVTTTNILKEQFHRAAFRGIYTIQCDDKFNAGPITDRILPISMHRYYSFKHERVLDLCCGPSGNRVATLQEHQISAFGIDIAIPYRHLSPKGLIYGTASSLPFLSDSFGLVESFAGVFLWGNQTEQDKALQEVVRVLSDGGVLRLEFVDLDAFEATRARNKSLESKILYCNVSGLHRHKVKSKTSKRTGDVEIGVAKSEKGKIIHLLRTIPELHDYTRFGVFPLFSELFRHLADSDRTFLALLRGSFLNVTDQSNGSVDSRSQISRLATLVNRLKKSLMGSMQG